MGKKYDYDYMVIGSGPAGSAAALGLAKSRKRIAIVDGGYFGGAHITTRDIPYAVALNYAHSYYKLSTMPEYRNQELSCNLPTVIASQRRVSISAGANNRESYESLGIT